MLSEIMDVQEWTSLFREARVADRDDAHEAQEGVGGGFKVYALGFRGTIFLHVLQEQNEASVAP